MGLGLLCLECGSCLVAGDSYHVVDILYGATTAKVIDWHCDTL